MSLFRGRKTRTPYQKLGDIAILLMAFFKKKNEERKLGEIPPEQLNCFLSKFIVTSKRKDGDEFEPSSLRGFLSSFNRHLKACKYPKNIMEDLEFEQTRKVSEA